MDIKSLKDKILQLAIQGKLVPQNENDEPASVLLEKIKAEKEQLIKDKIIKKEKPLPEISEEEKSFDLPKGWEWCRLGEIVELRSGNSYELCKDDDINKIMYIKVSDMNTKENFYSINTSENYDDKIVAKFRKYDSIKDSINDHGKFLTENKRYEESGLFKATHYTTQAQALEDAGYATKKNEEADNP